MILKWCPCRTRPILFLFGRAALASTMDAMDKAADGKGAKGTSGEAFGDSEEGKRLLENLEGRRVTVTGVFDHSKEVLVGEKAEGEGDRRGLVDTFFVQHKHAHEGHDVCGTRYRTLWTDFRGSALRNEFDCNTQRLLLRIALASTRFFRRCPRRR